MKITNHSSWFRWSQQDSGARQEELGSQRRKERSQRQVQDTLKAVGDVTVLSRVDLDRTGRSWGNSRVTRVQPQ